MDERAFARFVARFVAGSHRQLIFGPSLTKKNFFWAVHRSFIVCIIGWLLNKPVELLTNPSSDRII